MTEPVAEVVERLRSALDDFHNNVADAYEVGDRLEAWERVIELHVDDAKYLLKHLSRERQEWVYFNPDSGEEYSPDHPKEAGICDDPEYVRKSTGQEDVLWKSSHEQFQRAELLTRERDQAREALAENQADVSSFLKDYERGPGYISVPTHRLERLDRINRSVLHPEKEEKA